MAIDFGPLVYSLLGIYALIALVCLGGGYIIFRTLAHRLRPVLISHRQQRRFRETVRKGYMLHQPMKP